MSFIGRMSQPYFVTHISERVNAKPKELDNNLDRQLAANLKHKLEGKCCRFGYVRPNSVVIVSRTMGEVEGCHFNGEITFRVEAIADVCRPVAGDRLLCEVENINRLGLLAKAGENREVHVYAVIQQYDNAAFFEDPRLKETAKIVVEVVGAKYKLKDTSVMVLGKIVRVLDQDVLEDYDGKSVLLPGIVLTAVNPDLQADLATKPPDTRAAFGYDTFGQAVEQLLRDLKPDERAGCLEAPDRGLAGPHCSTVMAMSNPYLLLDPPPDTAPVDVAAILHPFGRVTSGFHTVWELLQDFELLPAGGVAGTGGVAGVAGVRSLHTGPTALASVQAIRLRAEWGGLAVAATTVLQHAAAPEDVVADLTSLSEVDPTVRLVHDPTDVVGSPAERYDFFASSPEARSEVAAFRPLLENALLALRCLKPGGHALLCVRDIFTKPTVKVLHLIAGGFADCHIVKPFATAMIESDRRVVLRQRRSDVATAAVVAALQTILAGTPAVPAGPVTGPWVVDIPALEVPQDVTDAVFSLNHAQVGQIQLRAVGTAVRLLQDKRRVDKDFATVREYQVDAAKQWLRRYTAVPRPRVDVDEVI